ncbi:Ferric reductase transmembrane component 3 [Pleurostoma richardsiae]|uniref:ferric-chelate reductase (NADPH) n=1 Tax=Pleurostoma richardsiae TaxID=41990 RepID=A0AA38RQF4_9PEZI|nr:Ferric reductase transmembrane component 3 [Pleurostoma richardsiae]
MDMSGMDMGTNMFQATNMHIARTYWYIIVAVLGFMLLVRSINYIQTRERLRRCSSSNTPFPTKPTNRFTQAWATLTAVCREMSYPQFYIPTRFLSWMTPLPLGRAIALLIYWAVIIYMMAHKVVVKDAYFWERIGFRNAWVTVTQVPLLYLLSSKSSVLGFLAGTSYERLNWMHRWVARTIFVTATVHGWHFWTEWVRADFVELELEMMPMVKYGLGAWAILLWSLVSSFAPLRHMWYEFFVVQHIISAVLFLWLIYVHVPDYARYNVWFAIAALCFDRFYRSALLVWQNVKFRPNKSRCKGGQRIGHQAQVRAVGDDITVVTVKDVHFSWKAGQHLYLWMPRIGLTDHHPYTIACAHRLPDTCICNSIQLVVRKHDGFSKRLHAFASKVQASGTKQTLTAFVSGPYGAPPRWDIYETLVLISASTGASFTLPILESVLGTKNKVCTRRIDFLLAACKGDEIDYYVQRLLEMIDLAADVGIELNVSIAITRGPSASPFLRHQHSKTDASDVEIATPSSSASSSAPLPSSTEKVDVVTSADIEKAAGLARNPRAVRPGSSASAESQLRHSTTRPNVEAFIRAPVEATGGETSVVVCGGKSLVASARNTVARLSDERAVHKGTGAQGIHLHVEEYCF